MDLTKRQQEIFDYIKRYSAKYGYPPTVRDIGKAVGLASSSTVHAHLANLEKLGLLRRDPSKPRAIELLDRVREDVGSAVGTAVDSALSVLRPGLPLVGHVAAGSPRRTSRTTSRSRRSPAATTGSTSCAYGASR
jgi:repressor LexA